MIEYEKRPRQRGISQIVKDILSLFQQQMTILQEARDHRWADDELEAYELRRRELGVLRRELGRFRSRPS
jgi:hypothetical protein